MIFLENFCHNHKKIQSKSMTSESPKRSRAPSPRSRAPSPPQGEAEPCREGTLSPKRSRRELPDYFLSESPQRPGAPVPEVPSQEAKHAAAKRRRPSVYIPSGQYDAEAERCREDTVSPERSRRELPAYFGLSQPKKRPGSGAPEARDRDQPNCCRHNLTPSSSDDEPPSPPLLQQKAKRHRRVVAGLIAGVSRRRGFKYPNVIETSDVFYDGVPLQEQLHAAAKRRGSMRRGSSPLRELSPDRSGGRSPEATKRLVELF